MQLPNAFDLRTGLRQADFRAASAVLPHEVASGVERWYPRL